MKPAYLFKTIRPLLETSWFTVRHMAILLLLAHHKQPMDFGELVKKLYVTKGAASRLAGSLCRQGFAVRTRNPDDDRRVFFALTPVGAKLVQSLGVK